MFHSLQVGLLVRRRHLTFLRLEERGWFLIADLGHDADSCRDCHSPHSSRCSSSPFPRVLWRTSFGLRLRSSGEAPEAAESLGVNVSGSLHRTPHQRRICRTRWRVPLIISSSYYRQGQTAGRGFIGLATMIFGNWRPSGILGGALYLATRRASSSSLADQSLGCSSSSSSECNVGLISSKGRQMRRGTTGIGVSALRLLRI